MGLCPMGKGLALPVRWLLLASLPLGSHPLLMLLDNPFLAMPVSLLTKEISYIYFITFKLLLLFFFFKSKYMVIIY